MEQSIEGSILDTLKGIFNRIFKDIMSGFDGADYKKDGEAQLDPKKKSDQPKSKEAKDILSDIPEDEIRGMSQTFKHKTSPKDYGIYKVHYWDLSNSTKNPGKMVAEILDGKSNKLIDTIIGDKATFQKDLRKKIDELMAAEKSAHETSDEDVSSASKVIKLNMQKILSNDYVDYQLTDLSSNCNLLLLQNSLPKVLDLDEIYRNCQEGDNEVTIEFDDQNNFGVSDSPIEDTKHILQTFFEETSRLYIYAYTYHFMYPGDLEMSQISDILKDIMDQIGVDLAEDGIPIEFTDSYIFEELDIDTFYGLLLEYTQSYNSVICLVLSYDKQANYEVLIRQIEFILNNLD